MRVIDRQEPEIVCECSTCQSWLAIHIDDVIVEHCSDGNIYKAECPVCDRLIVLTDKIPYSWKLNI